MIMLNDLLGLLRRLNGRFVGHLMILDGYKVLQRCLLLKTGQNGLVAFLKSSGMMSTCCQTQWFTSWFQVININKPNCIYLILTDYTYSSWLIIIYYAMIYLQVSLATMDRYILLARKQRF